MPPQYVKAYVKRGKTDAADAKVICEAMSRPTMRFVAIKTPDEQADAGQCLKGRPQTADKGLAFAEPF